MTSPSDNQTQEQQTKGQSLFEAFNPAVQRAEMKSRVQDRMGSYASSEEENKNLVFFDDASQGNATAQASESRSTAVVVPNLNLPGSLYQQKTQQKHLKTDNELEIEKRQSQKVNGPLEKPWNNFGVPKAGENEQLINIDKEVSQKKRLKIKETVDKQMEKIMKEKRGWAYYEKYQPDYAAFEAEIKKTIMQLLHPAVEANTSNSQKIDYIKDEQLKLTKRLEDIEIVYKRVTKNASAQQDALRNLETRAKALRLTEERLRDQVKECEGIKEQLADKFRLLRDDRTEVLLRLDHIDHELNGYRQDVRSQHDKIESSLFNELNDTRKKVLQNETANKELFQRMDKLAADFDAIVQEDLRDQAVNVGKLQDSYYQHRKAISDMDRALVTKFDWQDRNRIYDHQISLLSARHNEIMFEFKNMKEYMVNSMKAEVQAQIDATFQAVFGDRKKYMRLLKDFQNKFYDDMDGADDKFKQPFGIKKVNIAMDSNDEESDDSLSRMKRQMNALRQEGALVSGEGGVEINSSHLHEVLKKVEEQKMQKVVQKFVKNMPLRRQSCYKENATESYLPVKHSSLRMLHNKQVSSVRKLNSMYSHLHIQPDTRLSGSISDSSRSRRGSNLSINRFQQNGQTPSLSPTIAIERSSRLKHKQTLPVPRINLSKAEPVNQEVSRVLRDIEFDKNAIRSLFCKLKVRLQHEIVNDVLIALQTQTERHPQSSLLEVKQKTLMVANQACKDNKNYKLSRLEIAAIAQVLALKTIKDENNFKVQSDFVERKREILKKIVELERKHRGQISSSDRSSKSSRHADVLIAPPIIAIEAQESHRSHQRSKTMNPIAGAPIMREEDSPSSESLMSTISLKRQNRIVENKRVSNISDLKSVRVSDESPSSKKSKQLSSESLQEELKLGEKLSQQQMSPVSVAELTPARQSSSQQSVTQSEQRDYVKLRPSPVKTREQKLVKEVVSATRTERSVVALKQQREDQTSVVSDFKHEESSEIATHSDQFENPGIMSSTRIDENQNGLYKTVGDIPRPDEILERFKDELDKQEEKLQERTMELRELQKYVKRFETTIVNELLKQFDRVFKRLDYVVADNKAILQERMEIIGNKFVSVHLKMKGNRELNIQENFVLKHEIKVLERKTDRHITEVTADHNALSSKYTALLHQNDFLANLANTMISIIEINTSMIKADQRDKKSICLMGSQGAKTRHEKTHEVQMHRLQQQLDDLNSCDAEQTQVPTQAVTRPKSGISHFSQKSQAATVMSQQTARKSKLDPRDDQPVIQLDKRCQTCSDDKGQLLHLFKIACLSYFPGKCSYRGKQYGIDSMLEFQTMFVDQLRGMVVRITDKTLFGHSESTVVKTTAQPIGMGRCEDVASLNNEDFETQVNSERRPILASSEGFSGKHERIQGSMPESERQSDRHLERESMGTDCRVVIKMAPTLSKQNQPHSNLKNLPKYAISPTADRPADDSPLSKPGTESNLAQIDAYATDKWRQAVQSQGKEHRSEAESPTNMRATVSSRPLKNQRVSFNKGQPQSSPSPQPALAQLGGPQTGYRFNATHELLAFNQEQIAKIVPNPITQMQQMGVPIDEKLLQIQKLKEKALLIQMTREVNKPNSFVAPKNRSYSGNVTGEIFPTREQIEYARDMARRKQEKETKIMIDTRERFTRRFQFEKLSHKILNNTPTETQISGSAFNELARYDSKTIFRKATRENNETRMPQTFANLVGNSSTSLPNLTRNFSAAHHVRPAEEVLSMDHTKTRTGRNSRPISSMHDQFWRTAKRDDGKRSMVILNQQRLRNNDWSKPNESSGTEQLMRMLSSETGYSQPLTSPP